MTLRDFLARVLVRKAYWIQEWVEMTHSRNKWRDRATRLAERVAELGAETKQLQMAIKKYEQEVAYHPSSKVKDRENGVRV